ncbi:hypothetical protein [Paraburkholderia caledonica]|uniref:Uncharacterized protein n=1 Tax=Paraburkholderia caledonica TaxID=134536 RepID=A0AB73IRD8_9BURK|nr:hypothetical protein [Paraburkholderia caledonica]
MSTLTSSTATVVKVTTSGSSTGGPISIPGLQVGDALVLISPYGFWPGYSFEAVVSVADELQQLVALDWSTVDFTFYLLRGV